MSRSASAPSASKPSGISDRRVFSRVSDVGLADLDRRQTALRSVRLTAFSRGDHARDALAAARRHVHCQKAGIDLAVRVEDLREQLGATVRAHAVERRPDSLVPRSPSLWQAEQAPVNSARPLVASPGFATSGSSAAMTSPFASRGRGGRVQIGRGFGRDLACSGASAGARRSRARDWPA